MSPVPYIRRVDPRFRTMHCKYLVTSNTKVFFQEDPLVQKQTACRSLPNKKPRTDCYRSGVPDFPTDTLQRLNSTEYCPLHFRQVFWLLDHSTGCAFPIHRGNSGIQQCSSPITAAGPSPIFTEFPIHPHMRNLKYYITTIYLI